MRIVAAVLITALLTSLVWAVFLVRRRPPREVDQYDWLRDQNKNSDKTGVKTFFMPDGSTLVVDRKEMISSARQFLDDLEREVKEPGSFVRGVYGISILFDSIVSYGSNIQDTELTEKLKALRQMYLYSRVRMLDPIYVKSIRERLDLLEAIDNPRRFLLEPH